MSELNEFLKRYAESTAYHEAGHAVAAVLQGLELRERGVHIDVEASGIAYYCHRLPGIKGISDGDRAEREKTIVALYAGKVAQEEFLQDSVDSQFWSSDWSVAAKLIEELETTSPEHTQKRLYAQAQGLVRGVTQWNLIRGLASTLWARPVTDMPQIEIDEGWSKSRRRKEKCLSGYEVADFLVQSGITCTVFSEGRRTRL